ncbi:MAG: 3,4-dihydroxy-2-butanone-4-phosphate synthase [Patescibacteria group bacterium]|nr:3,4-dihydroxy-2-butanone-4-phosphate synthase [Patescibacteria group bacterium]
MRNPFSSIKEAIEDFKRGNMLIVIDNPARENQGDLIFPAEKVTKEKVNFLLKNCRGLICVAITKEQARKLKLPLMVDPIENSETTGVQFTVTVDARQVKSFGISALDRAKTIRILSKPEAKPTDLVRPGHIFPLLARDGGVLERAGHTEAAIDLMRLAGLFPVAVLSEILNEKGEVARFSELLKFSQKFKIKILSIETLIAYLKKHPLPSLDTRTTFKTASSSLLTKYGLFNLAVYKSIIDSREHIALFKGIQGKRIKTPLLTRIHCQCLTGETFSSLKCDCQQQLEKSLKLLAKRKQGILIYLNQEGRGIGLSNKIKAYCLQEKGLDTVSANEALGLPIDARDYQVAAEILKDLGISKIELLTNNPQKIKQLKDFGIEVTRQIPLECVSETNKTYLQVKKYKLGHILKQV